MTVTAATLLLGGIAGCGVDNQAQDMGGAQHRNLTVEQRGAGVTGARWTGEGPITDMMTPGDRTGGFGVRGGAGVHGGAGARGGGLFGGAGAQGGAGLGGAGVHGGAGAGARGGGLFGGAGAQGGAGLGGAGVHGGAGAGAQGGGLFGGAGAQGGAGLGGGLLGGQAGAGTGADRGQLGVQDRRLPANIHGGPAVGDLGTRGIGAPIGARGRGLADGPQMDGGWGAQQGRTGLTGQGQGLFGGHGTGIFDQTAPPQGHLIGAQRPGMGRSGLVGDRPGMVDNRGILRDRVTPGHEAGQRGLGTQQHGMQGQQARGARYHQDYDGQTVQKIQQRVNEIDNVRDARVIVHDNTVVIGIEATGRDHAQVKKQVQQQVQKMAEGKQVHVVTDQDAVTRIRTMDDRLRGGTAFEEIGATFTEMVRDIGRAAGRPFERTR